MTERNYQTIEIKLGNYIKKFEMRDNFIGTFIVNNRLFNVIGTGHSLERLYERGLSKYHVLSSIVGLGEKLATHNNSGKHIIISDETKDISTIFTVENFTIVIITVLDRGEMYISPKVTHKQTIIETYDNVG
jgi:hypothetical protein